MPRKYKRRARKPRQYVKRKRSVVRRKKTYNKKRRSRYKRRAGKRFGGIRKNTATIKVECGGNGSDPNAVYLGHGTPTYSLERVVFMTLIKTLLAKHGVTFVSFGESTLDLVNTGTNISIVLYWNFGPTAQTDWEEARVDITASTDTYYTVATNLMETFNTAYRTATASQPNRALIPVFHRIVLRTGTGSLPDYQLAMVELRKATVSIFHKSSMRIQNRTASAGSASLTDVNNVNPLECKLYHGKKGKNHVDVKYKADGGDADAEYMAPEFILSVIGFNAGSVSANMWKDLPSAKDAGEQKAVPFVLHPGQVAVDNFVYKRNISLSTLISKLAPGFKVPSVATPYVGSPIAANIGYHRLFGCEKLIADRAESNPVYLGYEINYTMSASLKVYNNTTVPYVSIL
ncbi:MAG: putative capsid protein [Arizlama virus AZLM_610]|nr:MAG: putative capsid protein [Arizlama virus]